MSQQGYQWQLPEPHWYLGESHHPIKAVNGLQIPLYSQNNQQLWVTHCARCAAPLVDSDQYSWRHEWLNSAAGNSSFGGHPTIEPGPETMWLAKAYIHALCRVATRLSEDQIHASHQFRVRFPAMAGAAKARLSGHSTEQAVYYIFHVGSKDKLFRKSEWSKLWIPPSRGVPPSIAHQALDGFIRTVRDCYHWHKPLDGYHQKARFESDAQVVFLNTVAKNSGKGSKAFHQYLGGACARRLENIVRILQSKKIGPIGSGDGVLDIDGANAIWSCIEQQIMIWHTHLGSAPASRQEIWGNSPPQIGELLEMTIVLRDDRQVFNTTPPGNYWKNADQKLGHPMQPCGTCRVVVPALLCVGGSSPPSSPSSLEEWVQRVIAAKGGKSP